MIKLENVSTDNFIQNLKGSTVVEIYKYIEELFYVYDIRDYQKLKDLIGSDSSDLDYASVLEILCRNLSAVERIVKLANLGKRELHTFKFDGIDDSVIDKDTMTLIDENNYGSVLLYTSPLQKWGSRIRQINRLSIAEIKYLLSHVDCYFLLNMFVQMRDVGMGTAREVVNAIDFYHQQLLRQASETQERGIDLFAYNKKLKDEIVESELKEIIEYIVDNADECVWGKLSDTQKKRMVDASVSVKGNFIQADRRNLIDMVSNYTTLGELEQGVIRKRTLDRFIVR